MKQFTVGSLMFSATTIALDRAHHVQRYPDGLSEQKEGRRDATQDWWNQRKAGAHVETSEGARVGEVGENTKIGSILFGNLSILARETPREPTVWHKNLTKQKTRDCVWASCKSKRVAIPCLLLRMWTRESCTMHTLHPTICRCLYLLR